MRMNCVLDMGRRFPNPDKYPNGYHLEPIVETYTRNGVVTLVLGQKDWSKSFMLRLTLEEAEVIVAAHRHGSGKCEFK